MHGVLINEGDVVISGVYCIHAVYCSKVIPPPTSLFCEYQI